ncbi:hypothetical protein [Cellulosimicrobium cellulans]|uniref:Uncharacterized protein n=1 Tax=Cellulosimicrobium cellulans TaxID=1710 RepID=A0A4Y4DRQ0_CELCE|nr:hypothetical protein [Cellulosimicrobium cellulans]GED08029.1 hypothetical protein CCE02nite_00280 [Cellulosimicrobium cellulans]
MLETSDPRLQPTELGVQLRAVGALGRRVHLHPDDLPADPDRALEPLELTPRELCVTSKDGETRVASLADGRGRGQLSAAVVHGVESEVGHGAPIGRREDCVDSQDPGPGPG